MSPPAEQTETPGFRERDQAPPRLTETRTILRIAGPLAAAYLADFAMSLTTKAIIGRLGYRELASIGLANDTAWELIIVLVGALSVVGVLVAQADGSGERATAGLATRHGFILATIAGAPAALLVWNLDAVLALTGQDPEVIAIMGPFLGPMALGVLPLLWFFVLRTFVAALARTTVVMAISASAVGLNYVLCLGFVEGAYGLPELGVAGAGWAKAIVAVYMVTALFLYTYLTPTLRGYGLFRGRLRIDPKMLREILRLGLPVAGIVMLEVGLFTTSAIFSGVLGAVALATYQILLAWLGIAFMLARGLAEAGMIRVAFGIGRGSPSAARQAGLLTMGMGVTLLTVLAFVPLSFPQTLVSVFLSQDDPGFDVVLETTGRLLVLVAFFQIFDGLQVMAAFALRGLRDTLVPLWMAALGYWGFGVAGGWTLAFPLELGVDGLWFGMAMGLTVTGSLLALRFWLLTRLRSGDLPAG